MGRKKIDLTGQRFGKLVVVGECEERSNRGLVMWSCLCDCGKQIQVVGGALKSGNTKSCGRITIKVDLTGQRFGKLVVLGDSGERGSGGRVMWDCICDCGEKSKVRGDGLKSGRSTSCGCFKLERLASMIGKNSPNYNPNLTDEERLKNRYRMSDGDFRSWANLIKDRDKYTCQICNQHGGKLKAHHLNGWNAFPEQRFDLDNGVTLCNDCHKDFHSQYGYGDNTREQFNEYAASKTLVLN